MYIIEVIPISRGIGSDTLSYFTTDNISIGSIVEVPLRNRKINGIVISTKEAILAKGDIKSAKFSIKKIDKIKANTFFDSAFIKTADDLSKYYATSIGSILNSITPEYILKNINKLKNTNVSFSNSKNLEKRQIEKYAIQGDSEERYGAWKSLIRQEFAKKKSLMFIMPTIEETEYALETLEKGIEGYIFVLNGSLNQKQLIETWNNIIEKDHPIVIIATGGFLSLSRNDIETIVVESENSRSYKTQRRPFIDFRKVCETFAENRGLKIYFADHILRIETLWKHSEGKIIESSPFKFRSLSTAKDVLVDMKEYKSNDGSFKIISDEVENLINQTKIGSERMVILSTRRGLAPTTVCGDCQNIVTCNKCSMPVVLHKKEDKTFFMCHRCGERRSANEYCKICGSWRLGVLGIGIDLVIEKIKEKFPDIDIFKIDSDSTKTNKTIKNTLQKFKSKPGSILIGTEMMLPYIHEKIENSAIISLDSLFALPDFRIQEKILHTLILMRSFTNQNFIVQTRKTNEKVFEYGLKGDTHNFFKDTIEERKSFNYPPFTNLIKITLEGEKQSIVKEMQNIQDLLDPYEVEVFPAFTHTIRGKFVLHGLIRIKNEKWPIEDLVEKIRLLPLNTVIKVDPDTLL